MTIMRTRPPIAHFEPYFRGVNPVRDCIHLRTKCQILADNLTTLCGGYRCSLTGSIDKSPFSTAFEPPNKSPKHGSTKALNAILPDDIEYLPHRIGGACVVYDGCLEVFFVQNP